MWLVKSVSVVVFLVSTTRCPLAQLSSADSAQGCRSKLDLMLVMDHSVSMVDISLASRQPYHDGNIYKEFTKDIVKKMAVNTGDVRLGMVAFSSKAHLVFDLGEHNDSDSILRRIDSLPRYGGNTYTADALHLARDVFWDSPNQRPEAPNVIILLTDGMSNVRPHETIPEANSCKKVDIKIFSVAIGKEIDESELRDCSSSPHNHFFHALEFKSLSSTLGQLMTEVCNVPVPDCVGMIDLAFAIDNSGSIRDKNPTDGSYDNYDLLKNFVTSLLDTLPIGTANIRVGAIRFASKAEHVFSLDKYDSKAAIQEKIDAMEYRGGKTNTAAALTMLRTDIFQSEKGDRAEARNTVILIADGKSNLDLNVTRKEAEKLKSAGVMIFVVGVTDRINEAELKAIASDPDEVFFFNATDIKTLPLIKQNLLRQVCAQQTT